MRQAPSNSTIRAQIIVGLLLGVAAVATLLIGREEISAFVGLLLLASYHDLRRLLATEGHASTALLGAAGVVGFAWCGYAGRLDLVPGVAAALTLALLATRVVLNEAGVRTQGVVGDIAATLGAAAIVGVLGAHVLLIRAVPRVGFRGLLTFLVMVISSGGAAFVVSHFKGHRPLNRLIAPHKTWEGAIVALISSVAAGIVLGAVLDPPFDLRSGPLFGAGVGLLVTVGDLSFAAVKRSAGMLRSGTYLGNAGGILDTVQSALFVAPAFYWAFRTIAL